MRATGVMAIAVLLAGAMLCQGCGQKLAEEPDVVARYEWDRLKATLGYGIDDVSRAARQAVGTLDLKVLRHAQDGVAAEIFTVDAQRDHITIDLEAAPQRQTVLEIRAGSLGDKNKSMVIFGEIMDHLRPGTAMAEQRLWKWNLPPGDLPQEPRR